MGNPLWTKTTVQKLLNWIVPEDRFCRTCEQLPFDDFFLLFSPKKVTEKVPLPECSLEELTRRAARCPFCRLVYRAAVAYSPVNLRHARLEEADPIKGFAVPKYFLPKSDPDSGHRYEVQPATIDVVIRPQRASWGDEFRLKFHRVVPHSAMEDCSWGNVVPNGHVDLSLPKGWLRKCETFHKDRCQIQDWSSVFHFHGPLWAIDVEALCLSEIEWTGRFVALSYVWGGVQLPKLAANLQAFKEDLIRPSSLKGLVMMKALPQTILDAIRVVQRIGEKFLWVDALCIPPDTTYRHDQIANMHQIYGSALFTIVAADGKDARAGLPGVQPNSRSVEQISERISSHLVLAATLPIPARDQLADSPWNRRGWTFQERLLSKRLLIFTGDQMFWQCSCTVLCEDVPLEQRVDGPSYDDMRKLKLYRRNVGWQSHSTIICRTHPSLAGKANRSVNFREYAWMTKQYTNRLLTYEGDILPAFAGLTRILERTWNTRMLWGLPHYFLSLALLWQPQEYLLNPNTRRKEFRRRKIEGMYYPSWSWAGWIGAVEYGDKWDWMLIDSVVATVKFELWGSKLPHEDEIGVAVSPNRPVITPYARSWLQCHIDMKYEGCCLVFTSKVAPISWFLSVDQPSQMVSSNSHKVISLFNQWKAHVGFVILTVEVVDQFTSKDELVVISKKNASGTYEEQLQHAYLYPNEDRHSKFDLFNVLLIRWNDDNSVAERIGLGKISQRAFAEAPETVSNIVLA